MSISITQIKADLGADLHGTTVNQLSNFYGLAYRAATKVMARIDLPEIRRTVPISSTVHGNAFDYACPEDLKGDSVIDIRPYAGRSYSDPVFQRFSADFDKMKGLNATGVEFEVRHDTATKTLRMSVPSVQSLLIDGTDDYTKWTTGGLLTNLQDDNFNTVQGSGSLRFDLTGDGYLERDDLIFDLSAFTETVIFECVYCQSTVPDGYELRIGSDSSNYKNSTVTANWDGTAFREGWNMIGFDLTSATDIGTPDMSSGTYVRFTQNQTGSVTDCRLDSITASQGKLLEVEYYSKYLFRSASGTFKERPTLDSDLINVDTDNYPMFYSKLLELAIRQTGGELGEIEDAKRDFADEVSSKRISMPSQVRRPLATYYKMTGRRR